MKLTHPPTWFLHIGGTNAEAGGSVRRAAPASLLTNSANYVDNVSHSLYRARKGGQFA